MPITSCRKCGQMVSSTTSKCHACGAPIMPRPLSAGARAILALAAAILLGLIAASFLMGAKANAESPSLGPHAVPVDRYGTWTCERDT